MAFEAVVFGGVVLGVVGLGAAWCEAVAVECGAVACGAVVRKTVGSGPVVCGVHWSGRPSTCWMCEKTTKNRKLSFRPRVVIFAG